MTSNRKAKAAARELAAETGRSYTHAKRAEAAAPEGIQCPSCLGLGYAEYDDGSTEECVCEGRGWIDAPGTVRRDLVATPPVISGPVNDRHWQDPESGIEDRWPHWREDVRRHEASRALDVPGGRSWHLGGRWTSPRGAGLFFDHQRNARTVLEMLYTVVLWETPSLAIDDKTRAWLLEQGADDRALGMFDSACYDLDRAARMLAGQHFGDSRHSAGTDERIAAYLASEPHGDRERGTRAAWRRAFTPFTDSEGYEHVILPWSGTRQILDAVLIRATGGLLPGTPVRVNSGPHKDTDSYIDTAWWSEDAQAPTGYILNAGTFHHDPFTPDQLDPHPPEHSVTRSYLRRQEAAREAAQS